jgi:SEC-C motif
VNEDLRVQLAELAAVHKGLINIEERDGFTIVSGALTFDATPAGLEQIIDSFDIEIRIPHSYPDDLPEVTETAGRIDGSYSHRNPAVGTMCLAAPVQVRLTFLEQPSLLGFVNRLTIPYLYGFAYWYRHGVHPFGELEHGHEGIAQYYKRRLGLANDVAVLEFLSYLLEHGFRGHHDCPCGSGKKLRACHGDAMRTLLPALAESALADDMMKVSDVCFGKQKKGELQIPASLLARLHKLVDREKKASRGKSRIGKAR